MRGVSVGHTYQADFAALLQGLEMGEVVQVGVIRKVPSVVFYWGPPSAHSILLFTVVLVARTL